MNPRVVAVLVVLLVALGGGALLVHQRGSGEATAPALGQPVLKGLKAAEVASLVIRDGAGTLTLERRDERWSIAERAGFPADLEKVREFVVKAIELKAGQSEPIGEQDRARLELDARAATVEFRGAEGKPLAKLLVGRKYFKKEPENPDTARADGRFVATGESERTAAIVSDPLAQVSSKSAEWVSRQGFAAEKVKSLDVRLAGGEGWRIERSGDNADWKLAGIRAGEKLEVTRANAASYSLNNVEIADVAAPGGKPEEQGLDRASTVVATTLEGLTYALRVGRLAGDQYLVRVEVSGVPRAEGKDAEDRVKKLTERMEREKTLGAHTLLVARSKLEDVLRKRADLLEKKDAKK